MASQESQQKNGGIREKPPPMYDDAVVDDRVTDGAKSENGFPSSPQHSTTTGPPVHSKKYDPGVVTTAESSFTPGWKKPLMSPTRMPGKPVTAEFPYIISSYHCPVDYQSMNYATTARAPWIARTLFKFHDPARQLPRTFPWRNNMHRCWFDQMGIELHPLQHDVNVYVRTVSLAYQRCEGTIMDWSVCIDIWHRRSAWLECLSYADIEALISLDTVVRTTGTMATTEDPLEHKQLFYIKYPKPGVHWVYNSKVHGIKQPLSSWDNRLDKLLGFDDPELRRLVDENMERHIECVGQVLST
ncbi:hypothetical protein B0T22DRAFT_484832 [Podospora appendiculata]|uniref:Uncharacterized protein n=1 Tax=Podospora appendiculata TaxID=314037 RepID=A0AAE0X1H3_9PEZI|nr:hypothetical protein B0T22DRAFT_484832 [Podospora appendiculata]